MAKRRFCDNLDIISYKMKTFDERLAQGIESWAKKNGITIRRKPLDKEALKKILEEYYHGKTDTSAKSEDSL